MLPRYPGSSPEPPREPQRVPKEPQRVPRELPKGYLRVPSSSAGFRVISLDKGHCRAWTLGWALGPAHQGRV